MQYIIVLLCLSTLLYCEPSAFELQSGSTKKEIKELKESSLTTQSIMADFQSKIRNIGQSIEGLKTLYEGLSTTVRNDSATLKTQVEKIRIFEKTMQSYYAAQNSQVDLINSLKTQLDSNSAYIAKIEEKIDKVSEAFSNVNNEVAKQVEAISSQVNSLQTILQDQINKSIDSKETVKKDSKQSRVSEGKIDFSSKKFEDILKEGRTLFRKKQYDKSKQYFEHLISKNKHLATSNYYLGEIYYIKKDYNTALSYFKISISHDENTSFMPILLWHTAWSFKYLNDNVNYQKFLNSLVELYPKSEQGIRAKDLVKNKDRK